MRGDEYLKGSIERGKQPRTMEQRATAQRAHLSMIGVPMTQWRVEHSRVVMEKGSKTISTRGSEAARTW